ncbi:hypothetical protein [Salsipaludibacter albus]|uniref:hypothetical protein n=1 Tax=Salsipaludibacter albus TaxID=2849650 RepID=UPI001EE47A50|nr:hypothetical protein [Salsipaludibacter albus]MBY5164177.1 hypothetical protein [Salsipaludibacter albus]
MPDRPSRPIRPLRSHRPRQDPDEPVRPSGPVSVARPDIPDDVDVHLPRGLRRTIGKQVRDRDTLADVERAIAYGAELLDLEEGAQAVPYYAWAKVQASRVADIREGLGVAHYQAGDFQEALKELRTYRRMAAAHDQDHLIADCLRGLGRDTAEVADTVEGMLAADGVPPDRQLEGLLVWAGAVRDDGDLPGARAVLRRADDDLRRRAGEEARGRFTWLAADLAEEAGDLDAAREGFRELARLPEDPFEAGPRLSDLG